MSNVLTKGGLRLYKAVNGAGQDLEQCIALAGDSVVLGIGDPVQLSAAGAAAVGNGPVVMSVKQGTATSVIYGVVVSTVPIIEGTGSINLGGRTRPASTAQYVLIRPANNQDIYEICDDGSAAMTVANIGNNCKPVAGVPNSLSGLSTFMIDATSCASGNATYPLKIVGVVQDATNDPASVNARWLVTLNNVVRSGSTGTVGI